MRNPKKHEKTSSSKKQTSNSRKKIFTLNDEILIFNRFLDSKSKTGQNTMTYYTPFYNSVKDFLALNPLKNNLDKEYGS